MNADRLLRYFERIAEAPNAVPRLRRFILDLGVRGKLVQQDQNDKQAAGLLRRIQRETERLNKLGKSKKQDLLPAIAATEVPFAVPTGWQLVRLGEALRLINGRAFKPSEWTKSGLPIIRIQNLNNADAPFNYCDAPMPEKVRVREGDLLIGWSGTPGTSFGAHIWDRGPGILNQHIFKAELIGDAFVPSFLKLAINSRLIELIEQAHGGVGLQHITKPKLENLPLTLPPLAEQHRIVAKVDELMALCDELEAAQAKREMRRDRLVAATLHGLNNGDASVKQGSGSTFEESAGFTFQHLPRLTTRLAHIRQLRQTILNLAVRGKLVKQNSSDEPASILHQRLIAEAKSYASRNRIAAPTLETIDDAFPWPAPSGWIWTRLAALFNVITDGDHQPPPKSEDGVAFLTIGNITTGRLDFSNCRFVPQEYFDGLAAYRKPAYGDILYTVVGATYGRPAPVVSALT